MSDSTQEFPSNSKIFQIRGYHALRLFFPENSSKFSKSDVGLLQPQGGRLESWFVGLLVFLNQPSNFPTYQHSNIPPWFGLFPFRSSLLGESLLISFFRLLRYFSSPTCLHALNGFGRAVSPMATGFPIGRFPGQSLFASSPKLFAGYYVLHRAYQSRDPLYTL